MTWVKYTSTTKMATTKNCVQTPEFILEYLRKRFGELVDPCPVLSKKFDYSTDKDGLKLDWLKFSDNGDKLVYVNPPYSSTKKWFVKAYQEMKRGVKSCFLVKSTVCSNMFFTKFCQGVQIEFFDFRFPFRGFESVPIFKTIFVIFDPASEGGTFKSLSKQDFDFC